jgi:formate-dependent nitrite reductase membrane component NrfD
LTDFLVFTELSPWGLLIASYLFLGGASGGAFCIAALGELKKKYLPLSKWAALVSTPALIVGLLFLIADLGGPTKAMNVYANVESSVMTWGSIIILLFILVGLFYLSFWLEFRILGIRFFPWSKNLGLRKKTAEIGLILALATMIYTGLLLGAASGKPLWKSPLIPVLFAISGLSSGMALTVVMAAVAPRDKDAVFHAMERVHKLDSYVIELEIVVVIALLGTVLAMSFTGAGSVTAIVTGPFALLFWGGLVILGFLIPLGLQAFADFRKRSVLWETLVSSFGVAISGFVLRYLIISNGYSTPIPYVSNFFQLVPVSSPTLFDYLVTAGSFALLAVIYVVGSILFRSQEQESQTAIKEVKTSLAKEIKN